MVNRIDFAHPNRLSTSCERIIMCWILVICIFAPSWYKFLIFNRPPLGGKFIHLTTKRFNSQNAADKRSSRYMAACHFVQWFFNFLICKWVEDCCDSIYLCQLERFFDCIVVFLFRYKCRFVKIELWLWLDKP